MWSFFQLSQLYNTYFQYILIPAVIVVWFLVTYLLVRKSLIRSSSTVWYKLKNLLLVSLLPLLLFDFVLMLYMYGNGQMITWRIIADTIVIALSSTIIFGIFLRYKKISYQFISYFLKDLLIGLFVASALFMVGKICFDAFLHKQPAWREVMAKVKELEKRKASDFVS